MMEPTTDSTLEKARTKILDAALVQSSENPWTQAVLDTAILEAGIDTPLANRAFPQGVSSLIDAFHIRADTEMKTALAEIDLAPMKIRDRITLAVRLRLLAMEPHRDVVRRAIVVQSTPTNMLQSIGGLYRTADAIWYSIGDTSTDFSFYTKRALVSGVCASTFIVWLSDHSREFEYTWAFLDRRISDALKLGTIRRQLEKGFRSSLGGPLERWPGQLGILPLWRQSRGRSTRG